MKGYRYPEYNREYYKEYRETHREEYNKYHREYSRKHRKEKRLELFEFLGNQCVKCGFSNWRALQIDHINGNGCDDRVREIGYLKYYKKVKENPMTYQLLCANCNWIKKYENGETNKIKGE